mgnify:CR=1 FL=1
MKKILALVALATFTFVSCEKDYTCTCVDEGTDDYVTEFLGVKAERVKRLARESLLIAKSEDDNGEMQFDADEVAKYKELAERFGGL